MAILDHGIKMIIKILGNGGAINDGLPYNAFMVENTLLVETPPDIMNSLFREHVPVTGIRIIYISHFHGDHYFGLPFLLLRVFLDTLYSRTRESLTIIGPPLIKQKVDDICRLAVGIEHPLLRWMDQVLTFVQISEEAIPVDNDTYISSFPMNHFIETWGFTFFNRDRALFSYFADTTWDYSLLDQVYLFPKVIIADLNGEPSDPVKVHMSEEDLVEKALPVSGEKIMYYGTHLKYQKESENEYIRYTRPGEVIEL
ncbi:MAG: MBL fold metallo-hydrolase [Spirochaetota bacterium]